jgi:PTH1 family peptidyl-tRNA hydrolase
MKVIAGLGNPGKRYEGTRHNTGFGVLDVLARQAGAVFAPWRFRSRAAVVRAGGEKMLLLKPWTYVNLSGESVAGAVRYYKAEPGDLLVVLDDMDLPTGRLRLRRRGGSGGHNGLRSIIGELGTEAFGRLRVGVGRNPSREGAAHVLGRFGAAESETMDRAVERAAEAARVWADLGMDEAMNRFNRKDEPTSEEESRGEDSDDTDRSD